MVQAMGLPAGSRLKCEFSVAESIGHLILWVILIVITFGLGGFFFAYYYLAAMLRRTVVVDGSGNTIGRLQSDLTFGSVLGHLILWAVLTVITLGLALPIYQYRAAAYVISKTRVEA